ncbi:MAG: restriction endonuclease [Candidatus Limnocylindrales bacterium]
MRLRQSLRAPRPDQEFAQPPVRRAEHRSGHRCHAIAPATLIRDSDYPNFGYHEPNIAPAPKGRCGSSIDARALERQIGPGREAGETDTAGLSFLDAAARVLAEAPSHEPLSYRTITARALEQGYLAASRGLTPEATMYAQLVRDVQRRAARGDDPRFRQFPGGLFGLAAWGEDELAMLLARRNRAVKAALLARIRDLDPAWRFEILIGELLTRIGFEVEVTRPSADGGIDVYGTLVIGGVMRTRMAVQAKRWRRNVQAPTVQLLRGALGAHDQGMIVTTSDFSSGAREEASRVDRISVALMNGADLVSLLVEHQIGVRRTAADLLELGELPGPAAEAAPSQDQQS